jgi:hypothetical protein
MKWKVNDPATPRQGDIKTVTRFAWLPHRIGGAMYWLCQYEALYAWYVQDVAAKSDSEALSFKVGNWIKVSEKAIKWIPA